MWSWRRIIGRARTGSGQAPARAAHLELGALGERLAVEHLKLRGYRVVATNFVAPVGRGRGGRTLTGEIDIIAYDETEASPVLVFVEVKTRSCADIALPQAAVDLRKQRQIIRAANCYRRMLHVTDEPCRYDVVSIVVAAGQKPDVMLLKNFFDEGRFRRSRWRGREGTY
jgi:putative endonuclease